MNAADSHKLTSFELADLRLLFRSDAAGLNKTLHIFMQELIEFELRFAQAKQGGDLLAIERLTHSLIGSAGMCGATQTSQQARRLCDDLRVTRKSSDELTNDLLSAVRNNLRDLRQAGFDPARDI